MANAEISLNANRSSLSNLGAEEPDLHLALRFNDGSPSATASLDIDQRTVCDTTRELLYAVAARAIGTPARDWLAIAGSLGVSFAFPTSYTTTEQNLAKAAFLIALWLEPYIVASRPPSVTNELIDSIIIDYSGSPGRQRYIYFPRTGLPDQALERLYRLHLLCRARISVNNETITRHFVPLVTPGISSHAFDAGLATGNINYRTWQNIRRDMGHCIQRTIRS